MEELRSFRGVVKNGFYNEIWTAMSAIYPG